MIESGTILQDRYLVKEKIGAGGMGAVYLATDQRFGSIVAIKETFFTDESFKKAFEREARLLNSLRHPALPRVSDHFIDGNGQFIVMEYISGDDLSSMIERGDAFSQKDVLNWGNQLLDALDYLHTQELPIVHRDIKPQNLKLTPRGQIILLDFGLAKGNATNNEHQTAAKSVFGYSRAYAPLEQIQGTGTDPRSDLYSLAATIYHLLTGKSPSDALTRATAVLNNQPDTLLPPNEINTDISVSISNLLLRAMALNANYRPSSAAAMRAMFVECETNPNAVSEMHFQTTPLEIFSQNTKLIGASGSEETENITRRIEATSTSPNEEATRVISTPQANRDSTETETVFAKPASIQMKKSGVGKALGATALGVILLGGGAFGGWYALQNPAKIAAPEIQGKKVNVVEPIETSQSTPSNVVITNSNVSVTTTESSSSSTKETKKDSLVSEKKDSPNNSVPLPNVPPETPKTQRRNVDSPKPPDVSKVTVVVPPDAPVDAEAAPGLRLRDLKGLSPAERQRIIRITKKAAEMQRKGEEMQRLGDEMDMNDANDSNDTEPPKPPKIQKPIKPAKKPLN